jgi:hypothetical protein
MNIANLGAVTPSTRAMPLLPELGCAVLGFVFYKHGAPNRLLKYSDLLV